MGYAKIDKNKIQPSPTLAALTGFLSGLNIKKKELQDREDAQNKQAVDWYKAMQDQSYKDRMATVAERGATSEEDRVKIDTAKVEQANQDLLTKASSVGNDIDKLNFEISKYNNEPKRQQEVADLKLRYDRLMEDYKGTVDAQTFLKKKQIEYGNAGVIGYEGKSYAEIDQMIKNTGTQLIQQSEMARTKLTTGTQKEIAGMNIGADVSLESVRQTGREKLALLRGETESADPKIKNFVGIQKANQGFFGTVLTSPNKIVDDLTAKYMTDRSQAEMNAWNELTPEQQKGLTAPTPVTMSKQAKGGWLWGKIGAKPTQMLVGSDAINFKQFTTQGAKNSLKSTYSGKKEALDYLIGRGVSETAAKSIIDEVYKP